MDRSKRLLHRISERLPYINIWLAAAAFTTNYCIQVFCQPVWGAAVLLVVAFTAFLSWPWLPQAAKGLRYAALVGQGLALAICGYCLLFMGWGTVLVSTLIGFLIFPLLAWVPVLFGLQILWRISRNPLRGAWLAGVTGFLALAPLQVWFYRQYREIEMLATRLEQRHELTTRNLARLLPRSYVAERIVGMHFRYHTRFEELDGWRPPLHDPFLDVCYQLRGFNDPLAKGHGEVNRMLLYHLLFPQRPLKPDCVCAHSQDGKSYRRWQPDLISGKF